MQLLAGPIVRRVEPRLASVWVATDVACKVELHIWSDIQTVSAPSTAQYHASAFTIPAGDALHIGLVVADLSDAPQPLIPERNYSYNLVFTAVDGTHDLQTLGYLKDQTAPKPRLALGYGDNVLPSFALPPRQLKDLRLLHGSCRRVNFEGPDAMVWIDDMILATHTDPVARPHQLFLTGDQIYADDLPTVMQYIITDLAKQLIGQVEWLPTKFGQDPTGKSVTLLPCDNATFPAGLRKNVIMHDARMSTDDGENHCLAFGEFCAMYLLGWSNELWPDLPLIDSGKIFVPPASAAAMPPIWALHYGLIDPRPDDVHVPTSVKADRNRKTLTVADVTAIQKYFLKDPSKSDGDQPKGYKIYRDDVEITTTFIKGLPRVRRALANIPSYMIFDDHEISDDWNFSQIWKDRVTTSPLGRTILRNGLMAYTLFQGWGNDPKQFSEPVRDSHGGVADSPQKQLLGLIQQMFPHGEEQPPVSAVADKVDALLNLSVNPQFPPATPPNPPPVTWHYRVPGSRHLVLVLDVRTRRSMAGRLAAPQNLSDDAVKAQIPTGPGGDLIPLSPEIDVVIVISSLVVMGPPIFDMLFGPLSYKAFDIKDHKDNVALPATNPDAIESWPNDEIGFERLMNALQPLQRVVLLSGDVHYSASIAMTYWNFRQHPVKPPARYAQFIGSALKNSFSDGLAWASQTFELMQRALRLDDEPARLGWDKRDDNLLSVPAGKQVAPALDARLQNEPVLLPSLGFPAGTFAKNPNDWAWRIHIVRDTRPDSARPVAEQLVPLSPQQDVKPTADAYTPVAVRHAKQLANLNLSRQMIYSTNVGVVRFEKPADVLTAIYEIYTVHPKAPNPDKAEIYMQHRVDLDTPLETPPTLGGPAQPGTPHS